MTAHHDAVDIIAHFLDQLARGQQRRFGENNRQQLQQALDYLVESSVQATLQRLAGLISADDAEEEAEEHAELADYPEPPPVRRQRSPVVTDPDMARMWRYMDAPRGGGRPPR